MVHKLDLFDQRVFSPLDVLVKDFFNKEAEFTKIDNRTVSQPVDIYEDEDGLTFEIACTGIPKELVNIELKGDYLCVKYDKAELPKVDRERRYFHSSVKKSSFNTGWKVTRRFALTKAIAEMNDGLLIVKIPYTDENKPKTLKIK
ncbi:Hsp20 family protein [bacterium]|nr:Hsp20 family protein [bacterium]